MRPGLAERVLARFVLAQTERRFHREQGAKRRCLASPQCVATGVARLCLRFGGRDYTLEQEDLATKLTSFCVLNVGKAARTTDARTLSEAFFRKFYAIFDGVEKPMRRTTREARTHAF